MYAIFLSYAFKKVARIKLGEMAATEIGDCLKAKSASQGRAAAKAPVNSGLKPPSDSDDKQVMSETRSLKSVLVLPPQIFGPFGPPKKRVNFDKFNQRHKCVIFCPLSV